MVWCVLVTVSISLFFDCLKAGLNVKSTYGCRWHIPNQSYVRYNPLQWLNYDFSTQAVTVTSERIIFLLCKFQYRNAHVLCNSEWIHALTRKPMKTELWALITGMVLPLQLLTFFFGVKVFNWNFNFERPAQHIATAASGPLAEAPALVLPDSELPAF
jgi:hypothetical protein